MLDEDSMYRWERRARKVDKRYDVMRVHGKGLAQMYKSSIEKKNKKRR